jgi:peptidoglycan/LPS O-acetylase OafA/YrhL
VNALKRNSGTLETKQHFEVLDGLRGVAALAVVVFHFMEWVYPNPSKNFIGHGFLAVDFFFCLSGFVIGYAYDNRIKTLGIKEFFKSRLIRLHPLVILGSVLGLIGFYLDPFSNQVTLYALSQILLLFLSSIFLIPLPLMEDRAFNLFGLNAPSWSLFWEYIANIFYALVLHKIGRRVLVLLVIVSGIGICFISYRAGNLMGGWAKDNFWDGGVRVAYSFLAGLLIYRSGWIIKNKIGFIGLSVILVAAFMMPVVSFNPMLEALVVLLYFPLLVSLGAGTLMSSKLKGICDLSGRISYPLYMTHYAAISAFGNYRVLHQPGPKELLLVLISGVIALLILAYCVEKFVDAPIRKYLNSKRSR